MNAWLDIGLFAVLTVGFPVYDAVTLPRMKRRMAAASLGERGRHYLWPMTAQWLLSAAAIALTIAGGRSLASIGLLLPTGRGLAWSLAVVALAVALVAQQSKMVFASERARAAVRSQLERVGWLLPRDAREMRTFTGLCVTAGICEEILFRGYVLWFLIPRIGVPAAILVGSADFGLMHAYQGARGIVRTAIVGLVLALFYRLTGSLVAPMIAHALVDWGGGRLSTRMAAEDRASAAAA